MKKVIILLTLFVLATCQLMACEIRFSIREDCKKETYQSGDEVVINIQVQFTHRVCTEGIKKTKFTCENLKILGATEWKEIKPGLYSRQIKATITDEKAEEKAKITAVRKCDKEGGYGVCTLKKADAK
jgi:hypothetical protein